MSARPARVPSDSTWTTLGTTFAALGAIGIALAELRIAHDRVVVTVVGGVLTNEERADARRRLDPRDDVAEAYGVVIGAPLTLVAERADPTFIRPIEAPSRRLLPREALAHYLTPAALRLAVELPAAACGALGAGCLLAARRAVRRRAPPPCPSGSTP